MWRMFKVKIEKSFTAIDVDVNQCMQKDHVLYYFYYGLLFFFSVHTCATYSELPSDYDIKFCIHPVLNTFRREFKKSYRKVRDVSEQNLFQKIATNSSKTCFCSIMRAKRTKKNRIPLEGFPNPLSIFQLNFLLF